MQQQINPAATAAPVGPYSQGILVSGAGQWLHIAGQVGIDRDGACAQGMAAQAELAWSNLFAVLHAAGMGPQHLAKVTTYVTDTSLLAEFAAVRAKYLGQARPASTLLAVKALARPEWLVEIEAAAFKPD